MELSEIGGGREKIGTAEVPRSAAALKLESCFPPETIAKLISSPNESCSDSVAADIAKLPIVTPRPR